MNLPEFKTPEVKFHKSGYEIRTDVLAMAKDYVLSDFHAKWQGWELSAVRDEKTGQLVTKIGMPEYPNLETILDAAEKMYNFVDAGKKKH